MNAASIPVTITPEALHRATELGLQAQMQSMIDYVLRNVPDLERIEVILVDRCELGEADGVTVHAYGRRPFDPSQRISDRIIRDLVDQFPAEVLEYLLVIYHPGGNHAG
jgi:hypothetical protein